jgi:hypothetical protein
VLNFRHATPLLRASPAFHSDKDRQYILLLEIIANDMDGVQIYFIEFANLARGYEEGANEPSAYVSRAKVQGFRFGHDENC